MKIVIQTVLTAVALFVSFSSAAAEKLIIGITLQPYYSYVQAVVGDKADILPLVDAGLTPITIYHKLMIYVV